MDITVVIPLYNATETIVPCIESVIASCLDSSLSWEIVVVNDGSTDQSFEKASAYIATSCYSEQITLISQQNRGVSSARNAGMAIAKGKYIAFNDADDRWTVEHISLLMQTFNTHPEAELVAGVYGSDNVSRIKHIAHPTRITIPDQMMKNYYAPPTAMIRKDVLASIEPFCESMRYFEDYRFFNQIVHRGTAYIVPQVVTHPIIDKQRWGETGLSGNLWAMERGELRAIRVALTNNYISYSQYVFASTLSLIKFMRRITIQLFRKQAKPAG